MRTLPRKVGLALALLLASGVAMSQTISLFYTTDVHGAIFNYDFIRDAEADGPSLANVHAYVSQVRDTSDNVILLDNGDFLQGSPAVYYYDNVDTASANIMASVFNFMGYDAVGIGNHDIEAQHRVYDKFVREVNAPVLAANVRNVATGEPYFKPYAVFERAGRRIAVIGLLTPHIPYWLPESFWSGMEFDDMIESARHWVEFVKANEKPDAIVGLFHAGYDYTFDNQTADTYKNENASLLVAQRVEGFDAILIGHDHKVYNDVAVSPSGRRVVVLDAGTAARNLGCLTMRFDADGRPICEGRLLPMTDVAPSEDYVARFLPQRDAVLGYTRKVVARLTDDVRGRESLCGSSAFVDVIHRTMLKHTGADISMSAPLSSRAVLPKGDLTVGGFFALYKYENMLSVVSMTGREVVDYLEYSYDQWIQDPLRSGHVLLLAKPGRMKSTVYTLDSAAGIVYTVDVTKPRGRRVDVKSMADGSAFSLKKAYKVALNSYRANGGGGHLELGAGIPHSDIRKRTVLTIPTDLRGLVIEDLEEAAKENPRGEVTLTPLRNWRFVPDDLVGKFMPVDMEHF